MMKHHTMKMHKKMKVIQNGNSKKRISTGKNGVVTILPPVSAVETHAVEKERKARTILLMAIPKELLTQLQALDAEVSTKNANHKFLRSLPPAWSNMTMTMR
ncbi:hypothetical protein Tco_1130281, partial [Tanacetum coccineum]